ncbi:MAG TPA: heparinase II/III family protein [Chitinophagaceae bacterium]|nr:heparinase II/III family protein [Chitinophagaceae bacterium]
MRWKCIIVLFLPVLVSAQITPRNLLQKNCPPERLHQVLLSQNNFRPFPQTPQQWKLILPDSMIQLLIKNGEVALKEEFPNVPASVNLDFLRNGNRTRYENIVFAKRNRLWNLVLAESIEGKKRFIDAIIDGIWSISEESFWGASAHLFLQKAGTGLPDVEDPVVDLFAAETAATLAFADYFTGPQLDSVSPLIRRRIYHEVNRRVFIPMQKAKYEWMHYGDTTAKLNNWTPWIMSNYLSAVLLLEKDPGRREKYVSKAIKLTDQYINGIGDDGGCEEGPHYWTFGTGCVLDVLDLLASASKGGIDIYQQAIIRNMGAYISRAHISGNYYVDVADSHPEVYPEAVMVWRFGKSVKDETLSSFGAWLFRNGANNINSTFHRSRAMYDLVHLTSVTRDPAVFHENNASWLPNVQLMTERLSNGLFVAAHGGHNGESHNHNDVGDFIIYASGDPVIIDVGSGTYTAKTFSKDRYTIWNNTSAYHNLPVINGVQQSEGADFAAHNVLFKKDKNAAILQMNIASAYTAGAGLATWKRTITAGKETVVINDSFQAKAAVSVTQTFMTVCDADISTPGSIVFTTAHGKKISLQYGKEWQVTKEVIPLITEEDQGLKVTWRNQPITRILLTLKETESGGKYQYIIAMIN